MIERIKTYGLVIAIISCLFLYVKDQIRSRQHDIDIAKIEFMNEKLLRLVDIAGPLLKDKFRDKTGKVIVRRRFVPPEGHILVTEEKDKPLVLVVANLGLTCRPGVGLYYNHSRMRLLPSIKIAYWGRYGLIINGDKQTLSVGVSRYLDDAIPYWHPKNVELFIDYQILNFQTSNDSKVRLGLRISL